MIHLAPGPTTPSTRGSVYLPLIATAPANPVAAFYDLLLHDGRQQRPRLEVCKVLEAGAMQRAWGLANGEPFLHTDSQGRHANGIARSFGCRLPSEYSDGQNYIESLTAGSPDARIMFDSLARSDHHSIHLFGLNSFFAEQYHVGIGMASNPESAYGWYWVVWTCACLD